jgi:UDP-N-acetylglucosamine--N-acetylmuramyl-(pentapeptide) pyrophosphoryl-undecaprenol N-acetylglucosamine transferase
MTLLFTGGHLTPALALIAYLNHNHPEVTSVFIGREFSQKNQKSHEKEEVEKLSATFIPFTTGKLLRGGVIVTLRESWYFINSFFHALVLIPTVKPSAVVSFGSYFAAPLVLAAWVWRIPIVLHEQTRVGGVANTTMAKFANLIALSYTESVAFFPARKTKVTGPLLRPLHFSTKIAKPTWLPTSSKPILYVTGGNQGSEIINTTVAQCLPQIVKNWTVIHQCGSRTGKRNYKRELTAKKQALSPVHRRSYFVREWITEQELTWIYQHAAGAISRSGANTTEELARAQIPTIFIPLPFSQRDEQLLNAKALSKKNAALILAQQHLTPDNLIKNLGILQTESPSMRKALAKLSFSKDSEKKIFELITRIATA